MARQFERSVLRTDELKAGDRVLLPGGIVRTVDRVVESGWLNAKNEPILSVMYREPGVPGVWSEGNSGCARSLWLLA